MACLPLTYGNSREWACACVCACTHNTCVSFETTLLLLLGSLPTPVS